MCAQSYPTLSDPMNCTHQALLSVEFSIKKYWSRLPFPPPGDLPDPGIKPVTPELWSDFLPLSHWGSSSIKLSYMKLPIFYHLGPTKIVVSYGRV